MILRIDIARYWLSHAKNFGYGGGGGGGGGWRWEEGAIRLATKFLTGCLAHMTPLSTNPFYVISDDAISDHVFGCLGNLNSTM